MALSDNLKKIREEYKLTKKELCEKTGISERAYLTYEFGEREPKVSVIEKLADFYGVSTDYLLGRTTVKQTATEEPNIMEILGINKKVDDDEFMQLYDEAPDEVKQIFVTIMMMMLQKNEITEKPRQRHVERLGDIEDRLKQEQEEVKRKDVI